MMPNPQYLEMISKKLDAMNKAPGGKPMHMEVPKSSDIMDIMGKAALEFMKKDKQDPLPPDPLFPNRNTY